MMHQAYLLFIIILVTLALFIWGRWRYDVVALFALIVCAFTGVVPFSQAFAGFSNPAVVTVVCVMVLTQSITQSGVVDYVVKRFTPATSSIVLHIGVLSVMAMVLSAFMNNIGALALMMPIAIRTAIQSNRSPSLVLMPLAFASALGGLITSIGTPPNILIANYRDQITGHAFSMFDFAPVGLVVAVVGVAFISIVGWKLLPQHRKTPSMSDDLFQIGDYVTEVKISKESPLIDQTIADLEGIVEGELLVVGLIRDKHKRLAFRGNFVLREGDIIILQAAHDDLDKALHVGKLELVAGEKMSSDILRSEEIGLLEAAVPFGSRVEGRSARSMRLRSRYHTNLIALAREGKPFKERLHHVRFKPGDVVLLQGDASSLREMAVGLGLLPLAGRGVEVGVKRKAYLPILIFATAILLTAFQIVPVAISFLAAILVMVIFNVIPLRRLYEGIDWSVIVLLGAMIPIGNALQSTGGTTLIANNILVLAGHVSPLVVMALVMIVTMTISDVMNNAATAVIMAPIAVSIANAMHVSIDPFLMAVAVGASCSFLTPIGHQNNTVVLGPGGYKFFDFFRLGLPLEIIVLVVSIPLIAHFWVF